MPVLLNAAILCLDLRENRASIVCGPLKSHTPRKVKRLESSDAKLITCANSPISVNVRLFLVSRSVTFVLLCQTTSASLSPAASQGAFPPVQSIAGRSNPHSSHIRSSLHRQL